MNEKNFLKQFEACTLPEAMFDHKGHVWLGWLYIRDYSLAEASKKLCQSIDHYASSLGAAGKFHKTLTIAFACLIKSRFKRQQSFAQFVELNQDVLTNAMQLIKKHYSDERLNSKQAKHNLIFPDLQDFPEEYKVELKEISVSA